MLKVRGWATVAWLAVCLLTTLAPAAARAQEQELVLAVRRLFGYGGGQQIEGTFRMELVEPPALTAAAFYIDSVEIATVAEAPFRVEFETGDYALGWHSLHATGTTPDGTLLTSEVRRFEFVSPETGWQAAQSIIVRVGGGVGLLLLIVLGAQVALSARGRRRTLPLGAPRKYGFKGGTICPKCRRPFSLHLLNFNLGTSYFDYCDHCGQWSRVKPAARERLAAAEQAERELAAPDQPVLRESAADRLRRQIEESKYIDEL